MATRSCRKASPLIRAPAGQFQCLCQGGSALKPFLSSSSLRRASSAQTSPSSPSPLSPPPSPPPSGRESTARYVSPRQAVHARPQPRAPFPIRQPKPFAVNDDPARLDEMYATLLGESMRLPAEVKWQAVTHKSFDHGRQPFNEKLATFGKRILWLHTSLHLLNSPPTLDPTPVQKSPTFVSSLDGSPYRAPEPFLHMDYRSITSVTERNIRSILEPRKLHGIANIVRLPDVMRWKPRDNEDWYGSGQRTVAIECLFAIVGAVALQRGGDSAGVIVRERFLPSLA